MSFDLQESIKTLYTDALLSALSVQSGETTTHLQTALDIANAAAALQILARTQQPDKRIGIHRMAKVAAGSGIPREMMHLYQGSSHLQGILNMTRVLFGEDLRFVEKLIIEKTQLKATTVFALLQMVVPAMLAVTGSKIASRKLNPEGFAVFMEAQAGQVQQLIPPAIGFPADHWKKKETSPSVSQHAAKKKKKTLRFSLPGKLKWSMVLFVSALLLFFIIRK